MTTLEIFFTYICFVICEHVVGLSWPVVKIIRYIFLKLSENVGLLKISKRFDWLCSSIIQVRYIWCQNLWLRFYLIPETWTHFYISSTTLTPPNFTRAPCALMLTASADGENRFLKYFEKNSVWLLQLSHQKDYRSLFSPVHLVRSCAHAQRERRGGNGCGGGNGPQAAAAGGRRKKFRFYSFHKGESFGILFIFLELWW